MKRTVAGILYITLLGLLNQVAQAGDGYRLLELNGHDVKWGTPEFGTRATLTYAIAGASAGASGVRNCRKVTGIDGLLAHSKLTRTVFTAQVKAALAMWESVANVRFLPARRAINADLLISAEAVPDGVAYTDVTQTSSAGPSIDSIKKAIICLNPNQYWMAAAPTSPASSAKPNAYKLKYVLAHEIGHALGLNHPSPSGELMSFEYNRNMDSLQPGDIVGIVALYGPQRHASGTPVVALNMKAAP
ncbi:MAG: matrixin family metalloprotease [Alphaproteobacteria bacterium]|nr:matrixin family metalloprotease [Alphaproteobacteria bacterium]